MADERLQKVLAQAGYGSRRACETLISDGRVSVDGVVVTELGVKVNPETADIRVDGARIAAESPRYVMLHKPAGYLSHPDPRAEYPDWHKLVKAPERLFAVGRLDQDSEGLLLLTNDGELANRLTHPRFEHPKTYLVEVEGRPDPRKVRRLRHGIMLDDGPTAPAEVTVLSAAPKEYMPDSRTPVTGRTGPRTRLVAGDAARGAQTAIAADGRAVGTSRGAGDPRRHRAARAGAVAPRPLARPDPGGSAKPACGDDERDAPGREAGCQTTGRAPPPRAQVARADRH